jgi:hypothetical protein
VWFSKFSRKMKIPTILQRIIDGTHKINKRDLLPRRVPYLKNRLAPPLISPARAQYYSRLLSGLGHDPVEFSLPPVATRLLSSESQNFELSYMPLAQRRVARELPERIAKINFIKGQMENMAQLIKDWRAKKRVNRIAKKKKYPF